MGLDHQKPLADLLSWNASVLIDGMATIGYLLLGAIQRPVRGNVRVGVTLSTMYGFHATFLVHILVKSEISPVTRTLVPVSYIA